MSGESKNPPAPIGELITRIQADSAKCFAHGHKEIYIGRAPGRLDLMGALADYTGSLACEFPLEVGAAVAVQRRDDRKLTIKNYTDPNNTDTVEMSLDDFYGTASLLPDAMLQQLFANDNQWAAAVAGAYPILARHKNITRRTLGANIACYSTVPKEGGAGSTSALACATLSALTAAYHLLLEPLETAIMAQGIQHHIVGIPGGVPDAVASELGKKDHVVLFSGQSHEVTGYLPVPPGFTFAGIHTGVSKSAWLEASRNLRAATIMAQAIIARMHKDLGFKKDPTNGCLAKISPALFARYFGPVLPESIDAKSFTAQWGGDAARNAALTDVAGTYNPRAAAGYHIGENDRAVRFVEQIRAIARAPDDRSRQLAATAAGAAMSESHAAMGELANLKSPHADVLIKLLHERAAGNGFFGARANAGTLAILAADTPEARASLQAICTEFETQTKTPALLLWGSSAGTAEGPSIKMPLADLQQ